MDATKRNLLGTAILCVLAFSLFHQDARQLTPVSHPQPQPVEVIDTPIFRVPHIPPKELTQGMPSESKLTTDASSVPDNSLSSQTPWSNPQDAEAEGGGSASYTSAEQLSECLRCCDFQFSMPDYANVTGITVTIRCRQDGDGGAIWFDRVQLNDGPGFQPIGDNISDGSTWPTEFEDVTFGTEWGNISLTGADVKSEDFGVLIQVKGIGSNAYIDSVTMTVEYESGDIVPPPSGYNVKLQKRRYVGTDRIPLEYMW